MPPALQVAVINNSERHNSATERTSAPARTTHHAAERHRATERPRGADTGRHQQEAAERREASDVLQVLRDVQHSLDSLLHCQTRIEDAVSDMRAKLRRGNADLTLVTSSEDDERGDEGKTQGQRHAKQHQDEVNENIEATEDSFAMFPLPTVPEEDREQETDRELTLPQAAFRTERASSKTSTRSSSRIMPWYQLEPRIFVVDDALVELGDSEFRQSGQMKTMSAFSQSPSGSKDARMSRRALPMHPDSTVRMFLDALGMLLLVYDSVMVPYMVAYEKGLEGHFLTSAWVTMLFWTFDLVANFATGYLKDDVLVTNWLAIARQYLRTWFLLDIMIVGIDWISIILHFIYEGEGGGTGAQNLKIIRLLKATRLVRVLAVLRSGRFAQVQDTIMRRAQVLGINLHCQFVMGISKLVFIIMWLNHMGSCLWWVFIRNKWSDTGSCWHDILAAEVGIEVDGELVLSGSAGSETYWYLAGMYWSVTAMFSGASFRSPNNSAEAAFSLAFVIFGMLFGSTLISSVAAMLVDFQMVQRTQNEKLRTLRKFLRQHQVKPLLSISIQNQVLDRMMAEKRLSCEDVPVLQLLSAHLRALLWREIYTPVLVAQPFLGICDLVDDALMKDLCMSAVSTRTVSPGEELFLPHTPMEQAYVIIGGIMQYTPSTTAVVGSPRSRQSMAVGNNLEIRSGKWLCDLALWTHWTTKGLAESVASGELLILSTEGLLEVASTHPEVAVLMEDYSSTMCRLILQERVALSDLRSEIQLDEDHIIGSLPQESRMKMSLPALKSLQSAASNNAKRMKGLAELEKEVREGRCYLGSDASGCVLRVVQVVTLRLRRADLSLCVKVGEWSVSEDDPKVTPSKAKLPGTKMRAGELPRQTVERLLAKDFGGYDLEIHGHTLEVEQAASDSYGVSTKYVRHIFFASLGQEVQIPTFTRPRPHELVELGISNAYEDVEYWCADLRPSKNAQVPVYAWVAENSYPDMAKSDVLGRDLFLAMDGSCISPIACL